MYLLEFLPFLVLLGICEARPSEKPSILGKAPAASSFPDDPTPLVEELKRRVLPRIPENSTVVRGFIDADGGYVYLMSWLQEYEFNVDKAERNLLINLMARPWLDDMDKTNETFAEVRKDLPAYFDSYGKNGQPVLEIWFSDLNLEKYFNDFEKFVELRQWMLYFFEMNNRRIYEQLKNKKLTANGRWSEGPGAIMILDLRNTTTRRCTRIQCPNEEAAILSEMITLKQGLYAGSYPLIFVLNRDQSILFDLQRQYPALSTRTQIAMKFIKDKDDWMSTLNSWIDKDQRSERFGGTIVRN